MKKSLIATLIIAAVPLVSFAQLEGTADIIATGGYLVNLLTGIVASLALLVFFWGLVKYIANAGDEKAKTQGKNIMIGGIIALFVLFSVWGIIRFLQREFGVQNVGNPQAPQVEF